MAIRSFGFTLLETLIVVSLIAMLGGLSLIIHMSSLSSYEFYEKQRGVVDLVLKARSAALHNKGETSWGVHTNELNGVIVLFFGTPSSAVESISLGSGIQVVATSTIIFLPMNAETAGGSFTFFDSFGRVGTIGVNTEGGVSVDN